MPAGGNDVTSAIQLALTPVFLLTGIAGMLNVMANRLSRVIDRARVLTENSVGLDSSDQEWVTFQLVSLDRRRHLANVAITACTVSALLVCTVIATLFVQVVFRAPLKWLVGGLFTAATLALVVGLAFFLREVQLATKTVRIPIPKAP
jgi:mannose/fructose/N-acetylgalactosamine-specific phosphotransferase system component IIC